MQAETLQDWPAEDVEKLLLIDKESQAELDRIAEQERIRGNKSSR